MKILVLGNTGMLGNYVLKYLKLNNKNVIGLSRNNLEINKNFSAQYLENSFQNFNLEKNDVIINCIGLIKPQVDKYGLTLSVIVNSTFPNLLAEYCEIKNVKLIHITTDCVFSGKKGNYIETDEHDITDIYGRTKSLGEPTNCTVIRTSIIGEEINQSRSLIEWIKTRKNKDANGFTDHIWNGVTCLQLAKLIEQIINQNLYWNGVRHIF